MFVNNNLCTHLSLFFSVSFIDICVCWGGGGICLSFCVCVHVSNQLSGFDFLSLCFEVTEHFLITKKEKEGKSPKRRRKTTFRDLLLRSE